MAKSSLGCDLVDLMKEPEDIELIISRCPTVVSAILKEPKFFPRALTILYSKRFCKTHYNNFLSLMDFYFDQFNGDDSLALLSKEAIEMLKTFMGSGDPKLAVLTVTFLRRILQLSNGDAFADKFQTSGLVYLVRNQMEKPYHSGVPDFLDLLISKVSYERLTVFFVEFEILEWLCDLIITKLNEVDEIDDRVLLALPEWKTLQEFELKTIDEPDKIGYSLWQRTLMTYNLGDF